MSVMRNSHLMVTVLVLAAGTAPGCGDDGSTENAPIQASARGQLNWKRSATLEQDLAAALELPPDELCTGPDEKQCISQLYLVPLGGNDPFDASLYVPVDDPLVTTPGAVDRVIFSACAKRVALDEEAATPTVFSSLAFGGQAPSADSQAVSDTATTLFRRFHGRNPDAAEIELVGRLTETDDGERVEASEFATMACYAVGSTTEFFFF